MMTANEMLASFEKYERDRASAPMRNVSRTDIELSDIHISLVNIGAILRYLADKERLVSPPPPPPPPKRS